MMAASKIQAGFKVDFTNCKSTIKVYNTKWTYLKGNQLLNENEGDIFL